MTNNDLTKLNISNLTTASISDTPSETQSQALEKADLSNLTTVPEFTNKPFETPQDKMKEFKAPRITEIESPIIKISPFFSVGGIGFGNTRL